MRLESLLAPLVMGFVLPRALRRHAPLLDPGPRAGDGGGAAGALGAGAGPGPEADPRRGGGRREGGPSAAHSGRLGTCTLLGGTPGSKAEAPSAGEAQRGEGERR